MDVVGLMLGLLLLAGLAELYRRQRIIRRLQATTAQEIAALELIRHRRHDQTKALLTCLRTVVTSGTETTKRALAQAETSQYWDDEATLSRALYRLFAEGERDPQLWVGGDRQTNAIALAATQQRLARITRACNENLRRLNLQTAIWPASWIARLLGQPRVPYFHEGLELMLADVNPTPVRARRPHPKSTSLAS